MLLQDHIRHGQEKRARQLASMRNNVVAKLEAELAIIRERAARQRAMIEANEVIRRARQEERKKELREKLIFELGDTALTLDDVLAMRPCRRVAAVKRLLGKTWDHDRAVTAKQALEAGCDTMDIEWVKYRLDKFLK